MANYIFIKTRQSADSQKIIHELNEVCDLLTPASIKSQSQNSVEVWSEDEKAFYAIQNSEYIAKPNQDILVIGWVDYDSSESKIIGSEADGSYAIIKNDKDTTTFFSDQFGSRTLWYFYDDDRLIVSTSQRAIVALKRKFNLNEEAIAWYLSSGCQGPFISWDQDIKQVLPDTQYILNDNDWQLNLQQKANMSLPPSGITKLSKYLKIYRKQVQQSLKQVVRDYPKGKVLLPLSGGLDSRLLLALSKEAGLLNRLTLVNWGVVSPKSKFDDKKAAHKVTKYYKKDLLNSYLPTQINNYDQVLNHFVEAGEGRIDHFNAFTDDFEMWDDFFQSGYRTVIRGDIPYPTGVCINQNQIRAKMGLELLSDYANVDKFSMQKYIKLQTENLTERLESESLMRWRDRTFKDIRVPLVHSAFSQQISAFMEIRSPMFSWSLYKLYMGLPDKKKGNKRHIHKLWKKYDKSGVSSKAISSLCSLSSYFDGVEGQEYLVRKLENVLENETVDRELVESVYNKISISEKSQNLIHSKRLLIMQKSKNILSEYMPTQIKAYLKSTRTKKLSAKTLAYRIVLIDKIIEMYQLDGKYIERNK